MRRWPNKVAIEFIDDGRKLTFKEVDELANRLAQVFMAQVNTTTPGCVILPSIHASTFYNHREAIMGLNAHGCGVSMG